MKDDGFRFDFSHSKPLSLKETHEIEVAVNEMITQNHKTTVELCTKDEAQNKGAMALFGEKYGDNVRVVSAGKSIELCGGIHTKSTGDIGFFKIIAQGAVASGIRRIEAITGIKAVKHAQSFEEEISNIKTKFKTSSSVMELVQNKDDELKSLKQQMQELSLKVAIQSQNYTNGKFVVKILENSIADLRQVANLMQGNCKVVFNRKGETFGFCLVAEADAKNLAIELQNYLELEMKYGGNDQFISGGGNGVISKEKFQSIV